MGYMGDLTILIYRKPYSNKADFRVEGINLKHAAVRVPKT